jgi:XRE family transcriptional regulator, fatty acid utilization regulator
MTLTRNLPSTLVKLTRLKRRRLEKGWTLDQLAEESGLSATTLGFLERGVRQPRPSNITRLAEALGCQPGELMSPEVFED